MTTLSEYAKQASRVIRTLHQGVGAALVSFIPLVFLLDLPAETVAKAAALIVAALVGVAKFYNKVFPAEPPLDENPVWPPRDT